MFLRERAVCLVKKVDQSLGEMAGDRKTVLGVRGGGRKQGYTRGKAKKVAMTGRKPVPPH